MPALVTSTACPIDAPLRERLAQLMMVRLGSNMLPTRTVEEDETRVAKLLDVCPVGGLVIFNGSFAQTPQVLARLQRRTRFPLLVAADFERGVGQQLAGWPLLPHAMAFDALGDQGVEAARQFGQLTASASRAAGVHIPFAPVADVNSDPRNPIIATRAFGTEPGRVSELVVAFVEGCRTGGALASAKHFPGHGNTEVDSHHELPVVAASRAEIDARDLPPFRAAIAAGVPLIMTAHVHYPSLDPARVPATLSHPILTRLLRDELAFSGAVVSDSFLMEGVKADAADEGARAVRAVAAGVDMLVDLADPISTLDALTSAVENGQLAEARVNEALSRVGRLKELMFCPANHQPGGEPGAARFDEAENWRQTAALALTIARGATTVVRNDRRLLPLSADRSLCAILVNPSAPRPGAMPPPLAELLRARFADLAYFELGVDSPPELLRQAAQTAGTAEQLLVAYIVKPAAWHRYGLPDSITQWLQQLCEGGHAVSACLGAPHGLSILPAATAQVCTFSDVPASQQALVERLLDRST